MAALVSSQGGELISPITGGQHDDADSQGTFLCGSCTATIPSFLSDALFPVLPVTFRGSFVPSMTLAYAL